MLKKLKVYVMMIVHCMSSFDTGFFVWKGEESNMQSALLIVWEYAPQEIYLI